MNADCYPATMLKYDDAYDFGIDTYRYLLRTITGKPGALGAHDYGILAQCVKAAGNGDYLEIGTLFGHSAFTAALTKRYYGLPGEIVCIDPLNGSSYGKEFDPDTPGIPIVPKTLEDNARRVNVNLEIVQAKSTPFPISGRRFAVTFIDGWHLDGQPVMDWRAVKDITDKMVIFHDYDLSHHDVIAACLEAANDSEWIPVAISGITFVVMKRDLFA